MRGNDLKTSPYPLGANCTADGIRAAFVSEYEDCGVILYDRETGRCIQRIPFEVQERIGNIHLKQLPGVEAEDILYQFYEKDRIVPDPYARCFPGQGDYGRKREASSLKAGFLTDSFDWGEDSFPRIPYEKSICYLLHVRGFTRHPSSGVAHKGTFLGVAEKIPYLKDLGITTVEMQPVYEFLELEDEAAGKPYAAGSAQYPAMTSAQYPSMTFAGEGAEKLANVSAQDPASTDVRKGAGKSAQVSARHPAMVPAGEGAESAVGAGLYPAKDFGGEGAGKSAAVSSRYPAMVFDGKGAGVPVQDREPRLNYWGYKKGFYYAPKGGYASGEDPHGEFCEMVKAFHENGMEVILQFYFPKEVPQREIPDILLYWVMEYHVDGFHVMGEQLPVEMIAKEPGLADTKLWFSGMDVDSLYPGSGAPDRRRLAFYSDDFMYDLRRFLKGDVDSLGSAVWQMRRNPLKAGKINYLTNYYGFTMMDLVSYEEKHNEANGENNRDGSDYNASWNCGAEGVSRKKQVNALRLKQYKNAMALLFLSQGTPLLFMGDEFGNSQKGNNNPYCQDNEVTWLNWEDRDKNVELLEFTEDMIAFRRAHPVLHMEKEPRMMDYLSCGYPDLSYHGEAAWRPSMERSDRQIGLMYCGKYAKKPAVPGEEGEGTRGTSSLQEDDFLYLAYNMHWEVQDFALPKLPKHMEWELVFMTEDAPARLLAEGKSASSVETKVSRRTKKGGESYAPERGPVKSLPPRTIAAFIGRER